MCGTFDDVNFDGVGIAKSFRTCTDLHFWLWLHRKSRKKSDCLYVCARASVCKPFPIKSKGCFVLTCTLQWKIMCTFPSGQVTPDTPSTPFLGKINVKVKHKVRIVLFLVKIEPANTRSQKSYRWATCGPKQIQVKLGLYAYRYTYLKILT